MSSSSDFSTAPAFDLQVGQLFRDTRPEALQRLAANIARVREHSALATSRAPRLHLRILWVTETHVVAIAVEDPLALDQWIARSTVLEWLNDKLWLPVTDEPLSVLKAAALTEKQQRCQDRNLRFLEPIIRLGPPSYFRPEVRGPAILMIAGQKPGLKIKAYRLLRRFFQGGCCPRALAGRWFVRRFNVGKGAVARTLPKSARHKGGRPRYDGHSSFRIHTHDIEKIIEGARRFLHTPQGGNWRRAWQLTVSESYLQCDSSSGLNIGEQLSKVTPDQYPSFSQFRYWAKTDRDVLGRTVKRWGQRYFDLNLRRLHDRTSNCVWGPGSVFQIDPTPYDLVIVHQITRRPIGKGTYYLVIDAFSHLIVGLFIHVGHAGYDAASLAMIATATNKVEFCRQFGIEISEGDWPAACLPEMFVADSELSSLKGTALAEKFIVGVGITPAYRADCKGLVEACLGAASNEAKFLPGYSKGAPQRATVSAEATACLDYLQLYRIAISWILQTNREIVKGFELTDEMIADGLVPTRINLWNWGIAKRTGLRRSWTQTELKTRFLPRGAARMTRRGLEFEGHFFEPASHSIPEFESWCVKAASNGTWNETVSYNPIWLRELWLHRGDELIPMSLLPMHTERQHWSYVDWKAFQREQAIAVAETRSATSATAAYLEGEKLKTVREAVEMTEKARGNLAQRRREKVDKPSEFKSQQDVIRGTAQAMPPPLSEPYTSDLVDEEFEDSLAALRASRSSRHPHLTNEDKA